MRVRNGTVLAAIAVFAVATGAHAQDVQVDFDQKYNFAAVKTFSIKIATPWGNQLSEGRVLDEFEQALTAKGWKKVDEGAADATVLLHGATTTQKSMNTYYSGGGYRFGGMGTASTTVTEVPVGTLVADIFDAKTKSLIFRGTAEGELSDKPEKNKQKLEKVTTKMFKKFPPGSTASK